MYLAIAGKRMYNSIMRGILVVTPTEEAQADWNLDIDIIDGQPVLLPEESNTQDQRAALAAYQAEGTIPGMPDVGISWGQLYTHDRTLVNINDQVQKNIQDKASSDTLSNMYIPIFQDIKDAKNIKISILKAGSV